MVVFCCNLLFWLGYNNSFLGQFFVQSIWQQDLPLYFKLATPVVLFLIQYFLFMLLLSYRYILKPAFIFLFIMGAMTSYSIDKLGVHFDGGMIQNIVETDVHEAKAYLSFSLVWHMLVYGVLPSALLIYTKISYPRFIKSQFYRYGLALVSIALSLAFVYPHYQQYSFIGRNNKSSFQKLVPLAPISASIQYTKGKYFTPHYEYVSLGDDAVLASTSNKPKLIFMVVGETARKANYSAYGYGKNTNRYTQDLNLISFQNITSCGTATAVSLPCMFSDLTRQEYNANKAKARDNAMNILQKAGVSTTWIENNNGSCKGVCDKLTSLMISEIEPVKAQEQGQQSEFYLDGLYQDEILLDYARQHAQNVTQDSIVVFHIMGSHGPKYYERYPARFRNFTPDCRRADVENCTLEEITNAYDNTIAYTDYVISQLIAILQEQQEHNDVALLYVSDHGESLGENGMFLHGAPYSLAPKEQYEIPLQLYIDPQSAQNMQLDLTCLKEQAVTGSFSHDNIFSSLIGLMQVKTKDYEPKLDMFRACRFANTKAN